jgi:hypothetical protein
MLTCAFRPSLPGPVEFYAGNLTKLGLDIGVKIDSQHQRYQLLSHHTRPAKGKHALAAKCVVVAALENASFVVGECNLRKSLELHVQTMLSRVTRGVWYVRGTDLMAHDMARRLEAEIGLSSSELEALPADRRVTYKEISAWHKHIHQRVSTNFEADTMERLNLIEELYREDVRKGATDASSTVAIRLRRTIALLTELDNRSQGPVRETKVLRRESPSGHSSAPRGNDRAVPTYDIFISHAFEDKETIARPLYDALLIEGLTVWFDEATLELGDRLRRKIDEGLAHCRYGVVVLSPRFFRKQWPQLELDGLMARETSTGEKIILPIWHDVDEKIVTQYSPVLAGALAARSNEGIPAVVSQILGWVRKLKLEHTGLPVLHTSRQSGASLCSDRCVRASL